MIWSYPVYLLRRHILYIWLMHPSNFFLIDPLAWFYRFLYFWWFLNLHLIHVMVRTVTSTCMTTFFPRSNGGKNHTPTNVVWVVRDIVKSIHLSATFISFGCRNVAFALRRIFTFLIVWCVESPVIRNSSGFRNPLTIFSMLIILFCCSS